MSNTIPSTIPSSLPKCPICGSRCIGYSLHRESPFEHGHSTFTFACSASYVRNESFTYKTNEFPDGKFTQYKWPGDYQPAQPCNSAAIIVEKLRAELNK